MENSLHTSVLGEVVHSRCIVQLILCFWPGIKFRHNVEESYKQFSRQIEARTVLQTWFCPVFWQIDPNRVHYIVSSFYEFLGKMPIKKISLWICIFMVPYDIHYRPTEYGKKRKVCFDMISLWSAKGMQNITLHCIITDNFISRGPLTMGMKSLFEISETFLNSNISNLCLWHYFFTSTLKSLRHSKKMKQ